MYQWHSKPLPFEFNTCIYKHMAWIDQCSLEEQRRCALKKFFKTNALGVCYQVMRACLYNITLQIYRWLLTVALRAKAICMYNFQLIFFGYYLRQCSYLCAYPSHEKIAVLINKVLKYMHSHSLPFFLFFLA